MPKKNKEILNPIPPPQFENEKSVVDDNIAAELTPGPDTEELSDISEDYAGSTISSKSSSSHSTWYRRIAPLVRNKQVRVLSLINCILTMINMIFFLALLALSCWLVALKMKYFELRQADMPCLYQFKPWSECSATCWAENESMPLMKREIDETKLVLARGKSFAKCPPNIKKGLVQRAPCNLQKCPLKLSSFTNWTACAHKYPTLRKKGGCYQLRKLPLENRLIYIDTLELSRNCPDELCPEYIP